MIDLAAIRIRDRDTYANITDENASFLRTGQVDRHDLLRYVDELLAERALIITRAENAEAALAYAVSTGDECAIEVEVLRKDAERYRWLRSEHGVQLPLAAVVWKYKMDRDSSEWVNTASAESLDAAIDAAMEQSHV